MMKKEAGFTLIELVIVIAILSITMSLVGFGVRIIYDSSVDAMAGELYSDLRDVRYKQTTEFDHDYMLQVIYEDGRYGYEILRDDSVAKKRLFRPSIRISKQTGVDTYTPYSTLAVSDNPLAFRFSRSTGKGLDNTVDGKALSTYNYNNQVCLVQISSARSDAVNEVQIVKMNGRVTLNEKN